MGNQQIQLPSNDLHNTDLEISEDGGIVTINTACGFHLEFDGNALDSVVTVKVPKSYAGRLDGLCGECDGKQNDLKTDDGADVSNDPVKYSKISESFVVDESSDEGLPSK